MDLSRQQRKELKEALMDAFPDNALLEQMLSLELDKNLNVIASGADLSQIVFKLIKKAEAENWVEDLVSAARQANPDNQSLKAIAEELLANHHPEALSAVTNQQITQPISEQQNENHLNSPSKNNQNINPLNRNRSKKVVVIATSSIFALLVASILTFNKSLFSRNENNNDEVRTYTVGALTITGDRQHVCNVLLPRGPGIGGTFVYADEESLWKDLQCENLYCDLSDSSCRTSLRSQWANPDRH